MRKKKYHYVYEITYITGKKYIGVRSCNCNIDEDNYLGSPFHLPEGVKGTETKVVLSTHETRIEAMEEEIRIHAELDVKNNDNYYNQCNATSTKFQVSEEAHKRSAETRRGRTKETHEYIAKQIKARAKYKGDGLTEAQKDQWSPERMEERVRKYKETLANTMKDPQRAKAITEARQRGGKWGTGKPNPKKGLPGLKHPKAVAWWYKNPEGNITIVNDSVRNYCNNNKEVFPMSKATIMRYLREDKVPNKTLAQGWDFGKIDGEELTTPPE